MRAFWPITGLTVAVLLWAGGAFNRNPTAADMAGTLLSVVLCVPVVALFAWLLGGQRMSAARTETPMRLGSYVSVHSGEHRGMAGRVVSQVFMECKTGRMMFWMHVAGEKRRRLVERDDAEVVG